MRNPFTNRWFRWSSIVSASTSLVGVSLQAVVLSIVLLSGAGPRADRVAPELHFEPYDEFVVVATDEEAPCVEEWKPFEECDRVVCDDGNDDAATIGTGGATSHDDAAFEGPGANGLIGIGGGAGGAFGGRRGGHRNLTAAGGMSRGSGTLPGTGVGLQFGTLIAHSARLAVPTPFPLWHTHTDVSVCGAFASTRMLQTFTNTFTFPVDGEFLLPLPPVCAVHDFTMTVGDRRIVGVVRRRAEARAIYEEARAAGRTVSLLEQDALTVFRQRVANLPPLEKVDVEIVLHHPVAHRGDSFEVSLPLEVADRYGDAPRVGDESAPDTRNGIDVSVAVDLAPGLPLGEVMSPTHDVDVFRPSEDRARVLLSPKTTQRNRDFVLRWTLRDPGPVASVVGHRPESSSDGYFGAFVLPRFDDAMPSPLPREITFVIDNSGSMNGVPLDTSVALARRVIEGLRQSDRFNVILFAGCAVSLADAPVDATPANVAAALRLFESLRGAGGTEMLAGVRRLVEQPRDGRYARHVCFLTDGLIGGEDEVLSLIREQGQNLTWHAFGIGSSVNQGLIEAIGRYGHGASMVVLPRDGDDATAAAATFTARMDAPLLRDVRIEAEGVELLDVYPRHIGSLPLGAPVVVFGRYRVEDGTGRLFLCGTLGGEPVRIPVAGELSGEECGNAPVAALWARAAVADLEGRLLDARGDGEAQAVRERVEDVALRNRLVTRWTSFVAEDRR